MTLVFICQLKKKTRYRIWWIFIGCSQWNSHRNKCWNQPSFLIKNSFQIATVVRLNTSRTHLSIKKWQFVSLKLKHAFLSTHWFKSMTIWCFCTVRNAFKLHTTTMKHKKSIVVVCFYQYNHTAVCALDIFSPWLREFMNFLNFEQLKIGNFFFHFESHSKNLGKARNSYAIKINW